MNLSDFHKLDMYQQIVFEEAYRQSKLETPTYICMGSYPKTKEGKEFFKPFLEAKIFHQDTLKFSGVVRLTKIGTETIEKIYKEKSKRYEKI